MSYNVFLFKLFSLNSDSYVNSEVTEDSATPRPSRSLSRLYLTGGSNTPKKPRTTSGSTPASEVALASQPESPSAPKELSPASPNSQIQQNANEPMEFKQNTSVLEQIGTPDREGWMRKKGEHYNTWKLRYFVLQGPHLYYLRSKTVRCLF